jgi:hypothetical protein
MSKPEYDVLRIEGSSNRVEVLMKNCDHATAEMLSSCIADQPGFIWVIADAGSYRNGDLYPTPSTKGGRVNDLLFVLTGVVGLLFLVELARL